MGLRRTGRLRVGSRAPAAGLPGSRGWWTRKPAGFKRDTNRTSAYLLLAAPGPAISCARRRGAVCSPRAGGGGGCPRRAPRGSADLPRAAPRPPTASAAHCSPRPTPCAAVTSERLWGHFLSCTPQPPGPRPTRSRQRGLEALPINHVQAKAVRDSARRRWSLGRGDSRSALKLERTSDGGGGFGTPCLAGKFTEQMRSVSTSSASSAPQQARTQRSLRAPEIPIRGLQGA